MFAVIIVVIIVVVLVSRKRSYRSRARYVDVTVMVLKQHSNVEKFLHGISSQIIFKCHYALKLFLMFNFYVLASMLSSWIDRLTYVLDLGIIHMSFSKKWYNIEKTTH